MASLPERVTRNEAAVAELRNDMKDRIDEERRTRGRLHDVEGVVGAWVSAQKSLREGEAQQYRRLEIRLQVLTLVVGACGVFFPTLLLVLHHG